MLWSDIKWFSQVKENWNGSNGCSWKTVKRTKIQEEIKVESEKIFEMRLEVDPWDKDVGRRKVLWDMWQEMGFTHKLIIKLQSKN